MARYYDTIGVIGGMGSYSTLYFFKRFLELFDVKEEYERPRLIIDNFCTLPNKIRAYLYGENVEELLNSLMVSLQQLKLIGCTKSLIVCNATHVFTDELFKSEKDLNEFFIDMIECLAKKIYEDKVDKVLIWTTRNTMKIGVFERYFHKYNIDVAYDLENNEKIIEQLMSAAEKNIFNTQTENEYIKLCNMYDKTIPIVLGCTELSMINGNFKKNGRLKIYDPIECVLEYLLMIIK